MNIPLFGAACFGSVVGWTTHFTMQRSMRVDTRWLGSIVAIIGGGALTRVFDSPSTLFGAYSIGVACAFFFRNFVAVPFSDTFYDNFRGWLVVDAKGEIRFEGSKHACSNWAGEHLDAGSYSVRRINTPAATPGRQNGSRKVMQKRRRRTGEGT